MFSNDGIASVIARRIDEFFYAVIASEAWQSPAARANAE